MRALLIGREWIDKILKGEKTWEIRGARTSIRETIALVPSGSGTVVGVCDVVDCHGPLTADEFRKNAKKAAMNPTEAMLGYYQKTYAWVLAKPRRLKQPVPYEHLSGAVIWVRLAPAVEKKIKGQLRKG